MSQTSYSNSPVAARPGMLAGGMDPEILSKVADGSVKVGQACAITAAASGLSLGTVTALTAAQLAVDVDSVIATGASTAGIQNLTTFDGTGAGGAGAEMIPARKLAIVQNNHADWDATTLTIYGLDVDGLACQATITLPNNGNATTAQNENVYFSKILKVNIPAQTGTNGTFTLGVIADDGMYPEGQLVIPYYDSSREPYNSSNQYVDGESVPCFRKGRLWVPMAATPVAGQQLYVRIVTGGGGFGELRGAAATGFVPFKNGRVVEVASSTLAMIEVL